MMASLSSMRRSAVLVLLSVTALTACSGSSAPLPGPSGSSAPSATQTSTAIGKLPNGGPAPAALARRWVAVDNDQVFLTFQHRSFHVEAGASVYGVLSTKGHKIWFQTGLCSLGVGEYQWSITHDRLHLDPVVKDPCAARADIMNRTYRAA
jgi:hypothetical protein